MSESLGRSVVIENTRGAAGMLGAAAAAKAAPNGCTLLLGYTSEMTIAPQMVKGPSHDSVRDFEPVAMCDVSPLLLVARSPAVPDVPTMQDIGLTIPFSRGSSAGSPARATAPAEHPAWTW